MKQIQIERSSRKPAAPAPLDTRTPSGRVLPFELGPPPTTKAPLLGAGPFV